RSWRTYVANSKPARTDVIMSDGHAHQVTGISRENRGVSIISVGIATTTVNTTAVTAAATHRRMLHSRIIGHPPRPSRHHLLGRRSPPVTPPNATRACRPPAYARECPDQQATAPNHADRK